MTALWSPLKHWLGRHVRTWQAKRNRRAGRSEVNHPLRVIGIEPISACNLLCKFCAYKDHPRPRRVMSLERFADVVGQAVDLGFRHVDLTPLTGEVFMDHTLPEKWQILEQEPRILSFSFTSNFLHASPALIQQILGLRKLAYLGLSVYGHDLKTFAGITQKGEAEFSRILKNFRILAALAGQAGACPPLYVAWRSTRDFRPGQHRTVVSDVVDELRPLATLGVHYSTAYNNWGGLVKPEHMKGLNVDMRSGREISRVGVCTQLVGRVLVMADGRVNACACRDALGALNIGDLATEPLSRIVSGHNPRWRALIEEQRQDHYPPICQACDFFLSAHAVGSLGQDPTTTKAFARLSLPEALALLDQIKRNK